MMTRACRCGLDQGQMSVAPDVPLVRPWRAGATLLLRAIRTKLFEIGPQVTRFLHILDAGEDHLGIRDLGARVLDVVLEGGFAPNDAGVLVSVCITVVGHRSGMAAVKAVELR